jgi:hypothetical protein
MDILVNLGLATICFLGKCHPALVGDHSFPGTYQIVQRYTADPGYGGDVLKYNETADAVYAIHRVWTLVPSQHRLERLRSDDAEQRKHITNGCINVEPEVYEQLVQSCKEGCTLTIQN